MRPGSIVLRAAIAGLLLAAGIPKSWAHPVKQRPSFVKPASFNPLALPPADQGDASTYWLLSDEQEDIASASRYRHFATKALSEAGLATVSRIEVAYDTAYEAVDFHRIAIWRNGASREVLPRLRASVLRREMDLDMGMLDGQRTLLFTLEDVRAGDIVEFDYTMRGYNPVFGGKAAGRHVLRYEIGRAHV